MRSLHNWFLLLIGVAFIICGLILLPSNFNVGIVTLAFFGSCAVLPAYRILKDLRPRPAPDRVALAGGIPIRPSRLFLGGIAAWVIIVASICLIFGDSYPLIFRMLIAAVLLAGCLMLCAVVIGWMPGTHLQFDPQGITLGYRRHSFLVGFDNIAAITMTEVQSNTFLLMQLHDPDLIEVAPPEQRVRVFKRMRNLERLYGGHIMIPTGQYRMDPSLLTQALHRYITEPSSRSELSAKPALSTTPRQDP